MLCLAGCFTSSDSLRSGSYLSEPAISCCKLMTAISQCHDVLGHPSNASFISCVLYWHTRRTLSRQHLYVCTYRARKDLLFVEVRWIIEFGNPFLLATRLSMPKVVAVICNEGLGVWGSAAKGVHDRKYADCPPSLSERAASLARGTRGIFVLKRTEEH